MVPGKLSGCDNPYKRLGFHRNLQPRFSKIIWAVCNSISKNDRTDDKTKHIDAKYQYTRELVKDDHIKLKYCETKLMIADFLTIPVSTSKFLWSRSQIGLCVPPSSI